MIKRIISLIIAVSVIMLCFVNFVLAEDIKQVFTVTLVNEETNGYVKEEDIKIRILGAHNGTETRLYDIRCTFQGNDVYDTITLKPGVTNSLDMNLKMKQGECSLAVTISYNGVTVDEEVFDFYVIKPYESQFMEQISKKGINGVDASNIDYFKLMGLQTARNGYEWGWTEKEKGVYDWPSVHSEVIDAGIVPVFLCCYGNTLYNGGKADKTGPASKSEIDAFTAYVTAAAEKYPELKYFEVWNEPNISFWLPEPNIYDYVNLLEVVNSELKRVNEDSVVIGGSMASSDFEFTQKLFELGISASQDAFCVHPYCYPGASDVYVKTQLEEFERKVLMYGGWQIKVSTEFGFPTNIGNRGISVEEQAKEIIKHFAITDDNDYEINQIYRMDDLAISGSHDDTYNEDNFGVVYYDKTPKPAVGAIKTMSEMTNGGFPLGKMNTPYGVSAYLYVKDKSTTAIVWRNERTNAQTPQYISFGTPVDIYDMNGNYLGTNNNVPVWDEPVYVKGISDDTTASLMREIVQTKINDKLNLLDGFDSIEGYDRMKELLVQGLEYCTYTQMCDEITAKNNLESYYENVLSRMIDLFESGIFKGNEDQLASLLYIAHLGGLRLMEFYMLSVDSDCAESELANTENRFKNAKAQIKNNACGGTLVNTENIYKFAQEMKENLDSVLNETRDNPMKEGMKKGWSLMIGLLSDIAGEMSEVERVTHNNVLLQLPSSEQQFQLGTQKNTKVSLYNYKDEPINGTVSIKDPVGRVIGKSEEISLSPDESMIVNVPVLFSSEFGEGEMLTLSFEGSGGVEKTVKAPFELDITGSVGAGFPVYEAQEFDLACTEWEYQWMYSYDDEEYYPMDWATSRVYRTSAVDKNRYIACEVTPVYGTEKGMPELQKKGVITSFTTVQNVSLDAQTRYNTRTTPPEYKFKLPESSREYVLLDVFSGETKSKYFVLSDYLTTYLEQHNTDPQEINPSDQNSIGYWLNNTFVNEGYSLAGIKWPKLEEEIYRYVDKEHKWNVEAGITGIDAEDMRGYSYTAGIGLLTETEAVKYLGRYGWNIKTENNNWYNPWLLATGSASTNQYIIVMNFEVSSVENIAHSGTHMITDVTPGNGHVELYARPAFYLSDDFFKYVRLDVYSIGSGIKEIILENYTKQELSGIYSEDELREIGFDENPVGIKCFRSSDNITSAKVEIPSRDCTVIAAVYDAEGNCVGVKNIDEGKKLVEFDIEADKMKVFYWDAEENMLPLYDAPVQIKTVYRK